ncbi:MAG: transcription antitermination factor NusB [Clostridia bacterium]|nr:transcription antitermination factor NusB [Clostridia bacterium]MBQ7929616.1 transcription antitermination factor NusB [Clostridia bacterium]MBQ8200082.1 transcription antitermination factor NusB [Lachnospiraceae bacterium]
MADKRHENRENVFTLLFAKEFDRETDPADFYQAYLDNNNVQYADYVKNTFLGVCEQCEIIDRTIEEVSVKWKLSRMATVTRTVLRLAVYEMTCSEVPVKVVINEAIEIAKKYDDENSTGFVNGILNKIARNRGLIDSGATAEPAKQDEE